MWYCVIGIAAVFLGIFLWMRPRYKALVTLIVMASSFDLAPRIISGVDTWDIGAVLLILTGSDVLIRLRRKKPAGGTPGFLTAFAGFYLWLIVCLLWSLLIYRYPLLPTLKFARQMLIGYLSIFIFSRLLAADEGSLKFLLNSLYRITFLLLPVAIVQYFLHVQILSGTFRDYSGVSRYLPVFLPFCLVFFWRICSRHLAGAKLRIHEVAYAAMVVAVVVMTYTRGIYATFILGLCFITGWLMKDGKLKVGAAAQAAALGLVGAIVLVLSGSLDRALARFGSAVDIVLSNEVADAEQTDTFTGRLKIVEERFALVARHNPLLGYGFLHDEFAPRELMSSLKYGSVIYTDQYVQRYRSGLPYAKALHSADAGWADMVLNTGYVGLLLFGVAIVALLVNYWRTPSSGKPDDSYHWRLALLVQTTLFTILMFESNPFVINVQTVGFMIAAYANSGVRRATAVSTARGAIYA
jgi:hypothetical protein